jgi:hypothetical protein
MTKDNWDQLKENLKGKFTVLEEGNEDLQAATAEGFVKQGDIEFLVVKTPMGKVKTVCEIRPMVLEKKFHYTHQQGQSARMEYKLSDTEKTYKIKIFKWDDNEDDWMEIKSDSLPSFM